MKTPRDKYLNDPQYKMLVDILCANIHACGFTPSEVREAAVLACILYEESKMKYIKYPIPHDVDNALKIIHKWTKEEN